MPKRTSSMLWLVVLLSGACAPAPRPIDGRSAYIVDNTAVADAWLRTALEVPARSFIQIDAPGKLPPRVRGDSVYWAERFLAVGARPLEQQTVEVAVHVADRAAPDLLRYRYRVGGRDLVVVESVNFLFVWVLGADPRSSGDPDAEIASVAEQVLDVRGRGHDWHFAPMACDGGELRFSTNAALDAWSMSSWADRVDGGTAHGALYFLGFKKRPGRAGYENADGWFDEEFRKHFRLF